MAIHGRAWSEDFSLLLIYTNSKRVWRRNTLGDYWLLDRSELLADHAPVLRARAARAVLDRAGREVARQHLWRHAV